MANLNAMREEGEVVVLKGELYAVLGYSPEEESEHLTIEKYHHNVPKYDYWYDISSKLPEEKSTGYTRAVALEDRLYIVDFLGIEIYDPEEDKWSKGKGFNFDRTDFAIVGLNKSLYVIGGVTFEEDIPNVVISSVEKYDIGSDTWTQVASLRRARTGLSAIVVDGRIFVIGGNDAEGEGLSTIDVYNPQVDKWDEGEFPPLPTPRAYVGLALSK
ncbi:hypothetical protein CYMTET_39170 [Cymbomonas tetramitiformis]|uniref:Uncharacterized protein n=1 Tax=Cymbomonas tetramitiformis TaxID=36881 RepID=A0AAE0CAM9_9CHLO|nr:hypothetical protein CYMTET_39170 [Cymbomonas tetramitiformis]